MSTFSYLISQVKGAGKKKRWKTLCLLFLLKNHRFLFWFSYILIWEYRYRFKTKLRDSQFTESRDTMEIILKTGKRKESKILTAQLRHVSDVSRICWALVQVAVSSYKDKCTELCRCWRQGFCRHTASRWRCNFFTLHLPSTATASSPACDWG